METIKILPIPGPWQQLCYAPEPLNKGMARCDRVKGHGGKHTWELADQIAALTAERDEANRRFMLEFKNVDAWSAKYAEMEARLKARNHLNEEQK